MNIALGAVIIFILLIPPIAFYLSFSFLNKQPKAGSKFSFLDSILASAIISLFVHAIAINILHKEIRFDILFKLLSGDLKDLENKTSNAEFLQVFKGFSFYSFIILLFSCFLGFIVQRAVVILKLDNGKNELTRLHNKWYYLFNGLESDVRKFDLLFVDAVVNTNDGSIIYSGFLINYICYGEELDRIYLGDVVRREFKRTTIQDKVIVSENIPGQSLNIPGNIFSLAYDNAINLNLRFIILPDTLEEIQELPDEGINDEIETQ